MTSTATPRDTTPSESAPRRRKPADGVPGIRPQKAAQAVAAELRRQIITGRLRPGDKLHPEEVLRATFGISRPTLREALRLLEHESLISISRGQGGGARVTAIDLGAVARQVGVFLQAQGTTLQDVWFARTVIEPPAIGLLAASHEPGALALLEDNLALARTVAERDPIRYADLSAEFSLLVTRLCGNRTLHLLAALLHDIIRRQHTDVTVRTIADMGVARLRLGSIEARERALALIRAGEQARVERFWREHLEHMRDLVMQAYDGPTSIDVLAESTRRQRPVGTVRRKAAAPRRAV